MERRKWKWKTTGLAEFSFWLLWSDSKFWILCSLSVNMLSKKTNSKKKKKKPSVFSLFFCTPFYFSLKCIPCISLPMHTRVQYLDNGMIII